jgi:hypothetical protein
MLEKGSVRANWFVGGCCLCLGKWEMENSCIEREIRPIGGGGRPVSIERVYTRMERGDKRREKEREREGE